MKKILIILIIISCALAGYSQKPGSPYGTRIRNNIYQVKGSDTMWMQLNDTSVFYNSAKKMKFTDSLFFVSIAEGQRAVDSFVLVMDADGYIQYLPIDSVGSTGGGGGFDSIYVEGISWIGNLDTVPTRDITLLTGNIANSSAPMDTLFAKYASNGTYTDSMLYVINPPHAFQGFYDSSVTIAITQNVWSVVTNATNTLYTVSDTDFIEARNDTLIIKKPGYYSLRGILSFSGLNNEVWLVGFHKNGTLLNFPQNRFTGSNDVGNISFASYGMFANGDKITVEVLNETDNDDITVVSSSIYVLRTHM